MSEIDDKGDRNSTEHLHKVVVLVVKNFVQLVLSSIIDSSEALSMFICKEYVFICFVSILIWSYNY